MAKQKVMGRKVSRKVYSYSAEEAAKIVEKAMSGGWLLWIKTSSYGNRKQLAHELVDQAFDGILKDKKASERINASTKLVDHDVIREVLSPMSKAQTRARNRCLPWMHDGIYWFNESDVPEIEKYAIECEEEFRVALEEKLLPNWDKLVNEALEGSTHLTREDFPTKDMIARKFRFSHGWQKVVLPYQEGTGSKVSVLGNEFLQNERKKFIDYMKENAEKTVVVLRESFMKIMSSLTEKLNEPNAKFKDTTVEKPKEFIKRFRELNIYQDAPFESLISEVDSMLDGVFADDLRNDDKYRKAIGDVMSQVMNHFSDLPTIEFERSIEL